jgi:hypothetical protein
LTLLVLPSLYYVAATRNSSARQEHKDVP